MQVAAPRKKRLFRPQSDGDTMAKALQRMLHDGRQVMDRERTRWMANRNMYRGEQYLRVSRNSVRTLAPTEKLPGNVRRVTINRLRPFVDSHIALLTAQRPPFKVESKRKDMQGLEGARIASKFLDAVWGPDEWDVESFTRMSLLYAHQDGVAIGKIYYDRYAGEKIEVVRGADGQIVEDPGEIQALREQDPLGQALWRRDVIGRGKVKLEPLRLGMLAVDPLATKRLEDACWVIEKRTYSRAQVEEEAGMKLADLIRKSKGNTGIDVGTSSNDESRSYSAVVDDQTGEDTAVVARNAVTVYEAFIKPTGKFGEWPEGAHIKWTDLAPDAPIVEEPWDRPLPYHALVPRPDGTHWVKSRGFTDDLAPVQVAFNRVVSMLHEWIDLVGRPPLVVQNGVLRSKTVFNEQRIVHVNGGATPPFFMAVPSEPAAAMNHLMFLLDQMKEITAQQDATRGQAPGRGIEAAVSLNTLIEQNEQQTAGVSAELKRFLEACISSALECVEQNYIIPRLVNGPVGEDPAEFRDFVGARLQGATNFRITGSLTPKLRSAQVETILNLAQYARLDLSPWVAQLVEGDIDEIVAHERAQEQKQKREIDQILALALRPDRDQLWEAYQALQQAYVTRTMALARIGGPGAMGQLKALGAAPPTLANVGITDLPQVEEDHAHPQHLMTLTELRLSPAWDHFHPLVKQGVNEHFQAHKQAMAMQMMAVADQQGGAMPPEAAPEEDSGDGGNQPPE